MATTTTRKPATSRKPAAKTVAAEKPAARKSRAPRAANPMQDLNLRPDIEKKLRDKYQVEYEYLSGLPVSRFDLDRSLQNQARTITLDEERVVVYQELMEAGEEFPPLIVVPTKRALDAPLKILDGNHRAAAAARTKRPLDAYVVDIDTPSDIIATIIFTINADHGLPLSEQDKVGHAIYLVDNGKRQKDAALMMGIDPKVLAAAYKVVEGDRRAMDANVKESAWNALKKTVKGRLLTISTDEVFKDAAHLAHEARLAINEVFDLVTRINATRSVTAQKRVIADIKKALVGRNLYTRSSQGGAKRPRQVIGMAVGAVLSMLDEPESVIRLFRDVELVEQAERYEDAAEKLTKAAAAMRARAPQES